MMRFFRTCGCAALTLFAVAAAFAQAPAPNLTQTYYFRRVLIADSEQGTIDLLKAPRTGPVEVKGVPVLTASDFPAVVEPFIGKPITDTSWKQLGAAIVKYVQAHDRPIVNVSVPPQYQQDIASG